VIRGRVGDHLSRELADMQGKEVVGGEIKLHEPGHSVGPTKGDILVRDPETGKPMLIEAKTGDSPLTTPQKTFYPKVPKGGLTVLTDQLERFGVHKGDVLEPGKIPEVQVHRWDIDSMPSNLRNAIGDHGIGDVLEGKAGAAARQSLLDWMKEPGHLSIEKIWRYEDGVVKAGDDLLDAANDAARNAVADRLSQLHPGSSPVGEHVPISGEAHSAPVGIHDAGVPADPAATPHDPAPTASHDPSDTTPVSHEPVSSASSDLNPAQPVHAEPAVLHDPSAQGGGSTAGAGGGEGGGGGNVLDLGDPGTPPHWDQPPNVDGDYRLGPEHVNTDRIAALTKDWEAVRYGGLSKEEFLAKWTDPNTGGWRWDQVPQDGFAVREVDGAMMPDRYEVELQPGTQIDRFGEAGGQFLSPDGTPYQERALPPSNLVPRPDTPAAVTDAHPFNYYRYEVVKPFKVDAGGIAPAFEQPGAGIQFLLDSRHLSDVAGVPERLDVAWLVENGYLRPLQSW
jgi:hypothetical protein